MRILLLIAIGACLATSSARAQAPAAGPLVLVLPASTRAASLGDAWVAGRDDYSIFYNPAQIAPTNSIGASFARYDWNGTAGAIASAVSVGTLTYGWGVEVVEFKAGTQAAYPFTPEVLVERGTRSALSLVAGGGASYLFKGFRTGAALKYAEDRVEGSSAGGSETSSMLHGVLLGDVGISHPGLSGTVALAVQNIGERGSVRLPTRTTLGWAAQIPVGEFDVGVTTQDSERNKWIGGGGGLEAGYGWIEGWSVVARAGAHNTEASGQRPFTMGGSLNADRLVLDYALELFEHNQFVHHIAFRWR